MRTEGYKGWILLFSGVALWDAFAEETLTASFHKALKDPKRKWIPITIFFVVSAHLWRPVNHLPKKLDIVYRIGRISECNAQSVK